MAYACEHEKCKVHGAKICWECGKKFCAEHRKDSTLRRGWQLCQSTTCELQHRTQPVVWRANINQQGYGLALQENRFGVGWSLGLRAPENLNWEGYSQRASRKYGKDEWLKAKKAIDWLRLIVRDGDLIWIRSTDGSFYIGRIKGAWEYDGSVRAREAHLANWRPCTWVKVQGLSAVPGTLHVCLGIFRPIQRDGDAVHEYSKKIYNDISGHRYYKVDKRDRNLFAFLSADSCEDVVALYLQSKGYRLIPSTCKKSTKAFEFEMKKIGTGDKACVQVKNWQGGGLNRAQYSTYKEKIFLFHANGTYSGPNYPHVSCIKPQTLLDFISKHRETLPDTVSCWLAPITEPRLPAPK